jgi:hypothetical protein
MTKIIRILSSQNMRVCCFQLKLIIVSGVCLQDKDYQDSVLPKYERFAVFSLNSSLFQEFVCRTKIIRILSSQNMRVCCFQLKLIIVSGVCLQDKDYQDSVLPKYERFAVFSLNSSLFQEFVCRTKIIRILSSQNMRVCCF